MDLSSSPPRSDLVVTYRVRAGARDIEARARAVAVEQSVEMPVEAIDDPAIHERILGKVVDITDVGAGTYAVRVALAAETVGTDAGQLLNMLFGNTSIHDDVVLADVVLPEPMARAFGGPNVGLHGLRARVGAGRRALICSALKPQGSTPDTLATLAHAMALGGIDYIKDDHGLADQTYSPFTRRVAAVTAAITRANRSTGRTCRYVPSLSGTLDDMRHQIAEARDAGIGEVLIAPMIAGVATLQALVRDHRDIAFIAHPALAGASRIAPPVHFGTLFRLLGADGLVFPNYGGRFGYSPDTCRNIAERATVSWSGLQTSLPIPAGGMTTERTAEILSFYGPDVMLLIGGNLLAAKGRLVEATARFVTAVEDFRHDT